MFEHLLDLAVLALAQPHRDPGVGALLAIELGFDRRVVDAVEADPAAQAVEHRLVDRSVRAHAISAQPPGRRQFEHPREAAVIGQKQEALGVDVEPADSDDPGQVRRQGVENRRPPLRIARRGDEAAGFMEQKKPRALGRGEPLAVDPDVVDVADVESRALQNLAVDAHSARGDPRFGVAARAEAGAGHHLGDAALPLGLPACVSSLMLDHFRWPTLPHCLERGSVLSPNARSRQIENIFRGAECPGAGESLAPNGAEENLDPMSLAFAEARAASARGEAPIGAALVRDGAVIARAGNRTRELADPTAHAELLVIRSAAAALGSERLAGCDLYVTLEPCAMCAGAMSHARIRRLYYAAPDPKGGAVDHGPRFFSQPTCLHAPEVYGGIRESEAAAMLKAFFAAKR